MMNNIREEEIIGFLKSSGMKRIHKSGNGIVQVINNMDSKIDSM